MINEKQIIKAKLYRTSGHSIDFNGIVGLEYKGFDKNGKSCSYAQWKYDVYDSLVNTKEIRIVDIKNLNCIMDLMEKYGQLVVSLERDSDLDTELDIEIYDDYKE